MNRIIFIVLSIVTIGCKNNSSLSDKINSLQKTNDSLKTILDTLKTKYIFDHAFVRHIPAEDKDLKIGQKYTGEFFFVAYNDEDKVLFSKERGSVVFDTLTIKRKAHAAYLYEAIAKKGINEYVFKPLVKDKFALEFQNNGYSEIIISDKKFVTKY